MDVQTSFTVKEKMWFEKEDNDATPTLIAVKTKLILAIVSQ